MKEIAVKNDWVCYQCNMQPLWEHRALCWGLSAFLKEQSKDEKKISEEEAENSPGYNPLKCCQGEKLPFYRPSHLLRPIVFLIFLLSFVWRVVEIGRVCCELLGKGEQWVATWKTTARGLAPGPGDPRGVAGLSVVKLKKRK